MNIIEGAGTKKVKITKDVRKESIWPIQAFPMSFRNLQGEYVKNCFAISEAKQIISSLDGYLTIFVRFYLEKKPQHLEKCKYIIGIRFYEFGRMATIDVVSLPNVQSYFELLRDHTQRMAWIYLYQGESDKNPKQSIFPMLADGGYLSFKSDGKLTFSGGGNIFGSKILGYDAGEIARQLAFLGGLGKWRSEQGREFLEELFACMKNFSQEGPGFYESFSEYVLDKNFDNNNKPEPNLRSLAVMKMYDIRMAGGDNRWWLDILNSEQRKGAPLIGNAPYEISIPVHC